MKWVPPDATNRRSDQECEAGFEAGHKSETPALAKEPDAGSTGAATAQHPKYKKTDKTYKLADAKGLYIEIDPSGGKYWRFKYRFGGKEKRLSLGVYPEVTLADARESHDELRKLLAKGVDPGVHRKAQKTSRTGRAEDSFEFVGREWYAKFIERCRRVIEKKCLPGSLMTCFPRSANGQFRRSSPKRCWMQS
jgi:hypothetical protein